MHLHPTQALTAAARPGRRLSNVQLQIQPFDDASPVALAKDKLCEQLWTYLQATALGPVESLDFIGKAADDYTRQSPPKG